MRVDVGVVGGDDVGDGAPGAADELGVEALGHGRESVVVDVDGEVQHVTLDRAVRQHDDEEHRPLVQPHQLDRADLGLVGRRARRPSPRGLLTRDEQLARLVEQVLERAVRGGEEVGDGAVLRRRQRALAGEVVDEEAVAAVGGHPAGRGVRLDDEALALEHGHVVADGGAAHAEAARARHGLRSDGLRGLDVLLHDRPEDRGLPFVEFGVVGHVRLVEVRPVEVRLVQRGLRGQPRRSRDWQSIVSSANSGFGAVAEDPERHFGGQEATAGREHGRAVGDR